MVTEEKKKKQKKTMSISASSTSRSEGKGKRKREGRMNSTFGYLTHYGRGKKRGGEETKGRPKLCLRRKLSLERKGSTPIPFTITYLSGGREKKRGEGRGRNPTTTSVP